MGNKKRKKSKRVSNIFKSKGVAKVTRNYKDTVFVDLFTQDLYAKRNIVSLVNAIYDSDLNEDDVSFKVTRLDNVLYRNMQNDVGVLLNDSFLILGEHQSTVNDNMPLRCLMYVSRIYEQLIKKRERYSEKLIKIPYPQFFVFYNGDRNINDYKMKLSDAFIDPKISLSEEEKSLELVIHFVNINLESGSKLLEKCKILDEYAHMISRVKCILARQREKDLKVAMKETIEWCKENDILVEYLSRKGTEVCNMLIAEYNDKERIEVLSKEYYQDGYKAAKEEDKKKIEEAEKKQNEAEKIAEQERKEKYMVELRFILILVANNYDDEFVKNNVTCTAPYIEDILKLVKDNSGIDVEKIYNKIIEKNSDEKVETKE